MPAASFPTLPPITLMGAGLVGSLLALYLARRGYPVEVYERRPDIRRAGAAGGRSINLALSDRGWRALEGVGIGEQIRAVAIPMYRRVMHAPDGTLAHQPYGLTGKEAIWSVSRGGLNQKLLDLCEAAPGVSLHFEQLCQHVDLPTSTLEMRDLPTGRTYDLHAQRLIGTDGAYSAVRTAMTKTDRFDYSQDYLDYGYKELTIAPGPGGAWVLEKEALHIWPRGQYMMIALPNLDGSFTCTLFFPFEGTDSFATLTTPAAVTEFFGRVFADTVPLMPDLTDDFFGNPTGSLVTTRCFPWTYGDRTLLIGDAAHAIVPFYGQGMNAGFEDCRVFDELLGERGDAAWPALIRDFQRQRKPDADAIAQLALDNFVEMRDRVADPRFLLQKKIEGRLTQDHPDWWLPLYSQVTFSPDTPYHQALANGRRQGAVMARVMPLIQVPEDYDKPEVQEAIRRELGA
ncbi:MAG: FAD-dependent monooxygenase [Hymenobacteraceae bacterium]|nr:FAD-dependent monooxygenase [Hymenobacteraceae bacterium]